MRKRCSNPNERNFVNYGGRGIKVCDRWMKFENFLADMGEKPPGMSIDRIDVNGDYEPGNCRWATREEQNRNTRAVKLNPDLVNEILGRLEHGESTTSVVRRFGIGMSQLYRVRDGKSWRGAVALFAGVPHPQKDRA